MRSVCLLVLVFALVLAITVDSHSQRRSRDPPPKNAPTSQPAQPPAPDQRGTEQMPLSVKVIPGQKSKEEAEKEERDRRQNEEKAAVDKRLAEETQRLADETKNLANYTGLLAAFTLFLVLAAVGQVALFVWQLRLIRESLRDAKIAADAAKASAEAATEGSRASRDSADTAKFSMVASDRAYVHFAGCRWISHRANDDSPVFWRIRPIWINGGNTPPRNLHIHTYHEIFDAPLPPDYPFTPVEAPDTPALLPPKGTLEGAWRDVWGSELVAVKQGIKYYYIWGTARYRDVFPDTPERVTKFCVFAGNIMGDPVMPWNEQTNKMDIAFGSYNRHNCADEDCSD